MSLDALAAIAQIGTFVVIAATAVAALIQLTHLRAANDMAAINMFIHEYEGPDLREAFSFVRTQLRERLKDPAFRDEVRRGLADRIKHPEIVICNLFDQWGAYYRLGTINRRMFMRGMAGIVVAFWQWLEPVIVLTASRTGGVNTAFEQFEYLTVQAQDWLAQHPQGDYPAGARRITLTDPWTEDNVQRTSGASGPTVR